MIKSIFHININVTNFDRSLEFYKTLGFKVVLNIGEGANPANDKGLGIPNSVGRAALLFRADRTLPKCLNRTTAHSGTVALAVKSSLSLL